MGNQGSKTPLRVSSDEWAEFVNNGKNLSRERTMSKIERQIEKQKADIAEAWMEVVAAGDLKSHAIDAQLLATEVEHRAFMAWRVECARLKTMEKNHE
tara:strand:- start:90 stop:383 length:294 start_codon:yes stop_codon:yes gene_type:complete